MMEYIFTGPVIITIYEARDEDEAWAMLIEKIDYLSREHGVALPTYDSFKLRIVES